MRLIREPPRAIIPERLSTVSEVLSVGFSRDAQPPVHGAASDGARPGAERVRPSFSAARSVNICHARSLSGEWFLDGR
jgi:hypothetical protein